MKRTELVHIPEILELYCTLRLRGCGTSISKKASGRGVTSAAHRRPSPTIAVGMLLRATSAITAASRVRATSSLTSGSRLLRPPHVSARAALHASAVLRKSASQKICEDLEGTLHTSEGKPPEAKTPVPGVGTPSPWAVDPWAAVEETIDPRPPSTVLQSSALAIPLTAADHEGLSSVSDILEEYEAQLQQRSSMLLGYPYNLNYDHDELHRFLRYLPPLTTPHRPTPPHTAPRRQARRYPAWRRSRCSTPAAWRR